MERKETYDLSGGQNSQVSPLIIKDSQCEIIQNYHLDNLGSLTKRNGIVYLIGQVVDGQPINNIFFHKDILGTDYTNMVVDTNASGGATTSVYKIKSDGTSWETTLTGYYANELASYVSFIDYLFRITPYEVMASTTNLTNWVTTNCVTTIYGKYLCIYQDRIYVANWSGSAESRIYWSGLPTGSPLAITWDTTNQWADINPDDGDSITWIVSYAEKLIVFKNRAMYRWNYDQVESEKIIDVGTPQGLTVKQAAGILFFANLDGVYAYTTGYPKLISRKMQRFFDNMTSATAMRAEADRDHYYLYIGTVTVDGITYTNCMLVYTISLDAWHIETYPFAIKAMARAQAKTIGSATLYDAIYMGDDDGFIYRKGTGTYDYNGTTATPINGYIKTKEYGLNFPKGGELKQLYATSKKAQGVAVNYRIDRGEWKPWRVLNQRVVQDKLSGRAKTIQLSLTDNSQTYASQIEGWTIEYEPKSEQRRPQDD